MGNPNTMDEHQTSPCGPPPFHKFCPYDGAVLGCVTEHGRTLPGCSSCGYIDYQNPRPAVAVIVGNDTNQLLLARRAAEPKKGWWDIPGGVMEPGGSVGE